MPLPRFKQNFSQRPAMKASFRRPKPALGAKVGLSPGKQRIGPVKKPGFKQGIGPVKPRPGGIRPGVPQGPQAPTPAVGPVDDAQYGTQMNNLNTQLANRNLAANQQEQLVRQDFGFDPQFANSPYTKASMLARRASQRFAGTGNSMAARGQLYSGALNRARASDELSSGLERDQAMKDYAAALANVNQSRLDAQSDYASGAGDAYYGALDRRTDTDPTPLTQPGGGRPPRHRPRPRPRRRR